MSKRELLVIRVITKAIKMRDIEMNLHNNLKDNYGQLECLKNYIYIYIYYFTYKKISEFITHLPSTNHIIYNLKYKIVHELAYSQSTSPLPR
jgi:hypothetical protein